MPKTEQEIRDGIDDETITYESVDKALNFNDRITEDRCRREDKIEGQLFEFIETLVEEAHKVETDPEASYYGTLSKYGGLYTGAEIEDWLKAIASEAIHGAIHGYIYNLRNKAKDATDES